MAVRAEDLRATARTRQRGQLFWLSNGSQWGRGRRIQFPSREFQRAAYVFHKASDGRFIYQVKLTADDGVDGETFGWAVATDGKQILVSSLGNGGTVYIFRRIHSVWAKEQKLKSPPVTA